ncbi:hypothetical protein SUDANB95_01001 [Actinosynnema sp. ALI-1.44]
MGAACADQADGRRAHLVVGEVGGKAFAFIGLPSETVGVKCGVTAEDAAEWSYDAVVAKLPRGKRP